MSFKNPFKRKDNFFKEINKQTKAEVKEIKKISDPLERQARYQALCTKFSTMYGDAQVQRSVRGIRLDRGDVAWATGGPASVVAIPGGIIAGVLFPPCLPAVAVVAVSAGVINRHLTYRDEAKGTGLTTRDIKFIVKTKRLESKARETLLSLNQTISTQRDLDKLRGKFRGAAEPTQEVAADTATPAVANKPAILSL